MAEGRGKAQADALRQSKRDVTAKRIREPRREATQSVVAASSLRKGDVVLVEAGDVIPADGEVLEGIASVNESAITGESAPVIRESGGDRSSVHGRHVGPVRLVDRPRLVRSGRFVSRSD